MHRLHDFLRRRVLRDLGLLVKGGPGDAKRAMLRSRFTEDLLWLHLGAEVGAFPQQVSEEVYQNCFCPFFKSLLSEEARDLQEMRQNRIYVAHSRESESLVLSLPRFAAIVVEKTMRGEDIFTSERCEFRDPGILAPLFQTLLIMASQLAHSRAIEQFIYQVGFADQVGWEADWVLKFDANDVLLSQVQNGGPVAPQVCAGYLELWGYAAKLKDSFSDWQSRFDIREEDVFKFRQRAKEIQSWVLNLRSHETSTRFEQVRRRVNEGLDFQHARREIDEAAVTIVQESIDSAFEFWFSAAPVLTPLTA